MLINKDFKKFKTVIREEYDKQEANNSDFDYNRQHPILGRTPHLRKGTTDVYKFDFGKKTIKNGIESGITFELKERETDDGSLKEFLTNMFKQNKKTP